MALADLSDVVALLSSGSYTVIRAALAARDTWGRALPPVTSSFLIIASIQPSGGRDAALLPEGWRSRERQAIFTPTALLAPTEPGTLGDTVMIDGDAWEVGAVENWKPLGNYCRAVLTRQPT